MPTLVKCPLCAKDLALPEELIGRMAVCPHCKRQFQAAGGAMAQGSGPPAMPGDKMNPSSTPGTIPPVILAPEYQTVRMQQPDGGAHPAGQTPAGPPPNGPGSSGPMTPPPGQNFAAGGGHTAVWKGRPVADSRPAAPAPAPSSPVTPPARAHGDGVPLEHIRMTMAPPAPAGPLGPTVPTNPPSTPPSAPPGTWGSPMTGASPPSGSAAPPGGLGANEHARSPAHRPIRPAPAHPTPQTPAGRAKFIAPDTDASSVHLGADGQLPQLVLDESQTVQAQPAEKGSSSNTLLLVAALCVSFGMSLLLLVVPTGGSAGKSGGGAAAWDRIASHYLPDDAGDHTKLPPYQQLLRRAQLARSQGDRTTERVCYRRVLDLLHAEKKHPFKGVTGAARGPALPNDDDLSELLSTLLREG